MIGNAYEIIVYSPQLMAMPHDIALVHDWLVSMRGGEKCLEALCEVFPSAHLFTLVHRRGAVSPTIERLPITTSFLQHMPLGVSHYQQYLPLFRRAIERFDLRDYDLVISSSHAVAKGVRVRDGALHVCYCHTPMRYIWDQYKEYFGKDRSGVVTRTAMKMLLPSLRKWDVQSSSRVHHFIANSQNVCRRIQRLYNRTAEVIPPPVDINRFILSEHDDGYFLIVSALVPYKRLDVAIEAFNRLGKKLIIVGSGREERKLKHSAKSNIEFVGWVNDDEIVQYYARCHALVFPGVEDFGIVPVEAMACGKPVVAFAEGGALETVVENDRFATGIFFHEQTPESLLDAVHKLDHVRFNPYKLRQHAFQFDRSLFKERMLRSIESKWEEFRR